MVGEQGGKFAHEVDAGLIEAVILPSHAKNYPNYAQIKAGLESRGIRIVEAQTSPSILNYSGGSILNVVGGGRSNKGAYADAIRAELSKTYPGLSLEDAAIKHLKSTGAIKADSKLTFEQHLDAYNEVATRDGLSR
jgi:hypothetical protein